MRSYNPDKWPWYYNKIFINNKYIIILNFGNINKQNNIFIKFNKEILLFIIIKLAI